MKNHCRIPRRNNGAHQFKFRSQIPQVLGTTQRAPAPNLDSSLLGPSTREDSRSLFTRRMPRSQMWTHQPPRHQLHLPNGRARMLGRRHDSAVHPPSLPSIKRNRITILQSCVCRIPSHACVFQLRNRWIVFRGGFGTTWCTDLRWQDTRDTILKGERSELVLHCEISASYCITLGLPDVDFRLTAPKLEKRGGSAIYWGTRHSHTHSSICKYDALLGTDWVGVIDERWWRWIFSTKSHGNVSWNRVLEWCGDDSNIWWLWGYIVEWHPMRKDYYWKRWVEWDFLTLLEQI